MLNVWWIPFALLSNYIAYGKTATIAKKLSFARASRGLPAWRNTAG